MDGRLEARASFGILPTPRPERPLDNLTHSLVGAAISKAGADRSTPLATATLVVAANAPDVDILSYIHGTYFALSFRRGITHGWPALVVLPFLVTAAVLAWDRWVRLRRSPGAEPVRPGPTLGLAALGVLTHPTLDWMNTYGMRWGLPFDGTWSYGDALFIIDPWIWLALGGSVFLASRPGPRAKRAWIFLGTLASALVLAGMPAAAPSWLVGMALIVWMDRTGRPGSVAGRRSLAGAATTLVALYIGGLVALDGLAVQNVRRAAEAAGLAPRDAMVAPMRGRLLVASVEVLTDDGHYVPGTHRWLGLPRVELRPEDAVPLVTGPPDMPAGDVDALVERARAFAPARDYLVWVRFPYVTVEPDGTGWRVRFADARYDDEPGAGGLAGVEVRLPGRDVSALERPDALEAREGRPDPRVQVLLRPGGQRSR